MQKSKKVKLNLMKNRKLKLRKLISKIKFQIKSKKDQKKNRLKQEKQNKLKKKVQI